MNRLNASIFQSMTPAPQSSSSLRTLVVIAAAVVALVGMYLAQGVLGPAILGAVIVIICLPVRNVFDRRGMPRWVGTTAVVVVGYLVLGAMGVLLWFAGTQFVRLIAEDAGRLQQMWSDLLAWLQTAGLDTQAADAASAALDPAALVRTLSSLAGSVVSILTALFFVFAYVIFMAADASRYRDAERVFGPQRRPVLARITHFNRGVRRYYVVNAGFGAVVAIIDGLALWALHIPAPVVWAILAFVTNFIPNIGFVIGLIPPALFALVIGGWPLFFLVLAIYCVVNVTLQVLIQPKFVSDAVDLSLTLSFFSVIFWTFIIGPLGAILSIPLTLLVRAVVLEGDPNARWARWLTGDDAAAPRITKDPAPKPAAEPEA